MLDLITTALEVSGLLAVAVAVGLAVAVISDAAGIGAGGVVLIVEAAALSHFGDDR